MVVQKLVELSEFCQSEKRRELKATFEELDVDNDGEINEEELRLFLGDVSTPEEVHRLFLVADENGDGKICLEGMYLTSWIYIVIICFNMIFNFYRISNTNAQY